MDTWRDNKTNRISKYSYQSDDLIGKGAAGKVYKGVNIENGENVAIKIMEMSKIDNEVTEYLLACEKEALLAIQNPYVLHAYDIIQTEQQCLIITPLCSGGTLKEYIVSKGKLAENESLHIFVKLLRGYLGIKGKGFVHRDIKSSNVMFRNGEPIIIDFGYCQKIGSKKPKMFYNVGSPSYMSPEAYMKTFYSEKSDLWSLGIVLYEMLEGFTIDHGQPIDRYFSTLLRNGPSFRSKLSQATQQMVRSVLNPNYHERPPTQFIIQNVERIIYQGRQVYYSPAPHRNSNEIKGEQVDATREGNKISLKESQKRNNQLLQQKLIESRYNYEQLQPTNDRAQMRTIVNQPPIMFQQQLNNNKKGQNINNGPSKLVESIYRPQQQVQAWTFNKFMVDQQPALHKHNIQPYPIAITPQKIVLSGFQQVQQRLGQQHIVTINNRPQQANYLNPNIRNFHPMPAVPQGKYLQIRPEKLTPEYRSMVVPTHSQEAKLTIPNTSNSRPPNVFHSKIFNAQSFLTVEDRQPPVNRNPFSNAKMVDSISHESGQNNSKQKQYNPVSQSVIVDPQIESKLVYGGKATHPIAQSLIINAFSPHQANTRPAYQNLQPISHHFGPAPTTQAHHEQKNRSITQHVPNVHYLNPQHINMAPMANPQLSFNASVRPLSPVASEGRQMLANQSARESTRPVLDNVPRNFIKKTEPYFHMNMNINTNTNMSMNMNGDKRSTMGYGQQWIPGRQTMPNFQRVQMTFSQPPGNPVMMVQGRR